MTLFEGRKVVKAKKTRPISAFLLGAKHAEHISESSTKPSLPNTPTESRTEPSEEELLKTINKNPEFEVKQQINFQLKSSIFFLL